VRQGQRGRGGRERHLQTIDKRERELEERGTGSMRLAVAAERREEFKHHQKVRSRGLTPWQGRVRQREVEETDWMMCDSTSAAANSIFALLPATIPAILRRATGQVRTRTTLWCLPLDMVLGDRTGSECFEH
jgi:hypothetical protein